jgi:hypothetical protein
MTLLRIAEICLISPALMRKMNCFAKWQTIWANNKIYISECKLSQYDIFNTILRPNLDLPQFGALMFKKLSVGELDEVIRPLVVTERHHISQGGFFIPCPNFNSLGIYTASVEEFGQEMMNHMQKSVKNLFQIDPDNFIARLCHNIYWYAKDLKIANPGGKGQDFDKILENFYPMFSEE